MKKIVLITGMLFLTLAGVRLMAGDPEFKASAPGTIRLGQQFQYTIEGNVQGSISLPDMPQFDLRGGPFTSFSSSTQWINGKMTATRTAKYTYIFTPNQVGEFTIPPSKVTVKRDVYSTNPVTVSVIDGGDAARQNSQNASVSRNSGGSPDKSSASGEDQPVFLRVIPAKRSVYQGEQLVSELKIYTSVNTRPAANMKDIPYEGFYKYRLEPDQSASRERINGVEHLTQVLQRHILVPQKSGKLKIKPYTSEWTIPQRVQRRRPSSIFDDFFDDPFNDPFFDSYQNVPVTIETDPVTINVKPLPSNAPSGFTGAVGDFTMQASLTEENVTVNDAINLVITITGSGNLSLLGAPKVSFPPDHDVYETVKKEQVSTSGNRITGSVTFEYPIVARHAGTYRIAPVTFSWFDPAKEKYQSATTKEFTFLVEKGEGEGGANAVFVPGMGGEAVADLGSDILDIERNLPDFAQEDRYLAHRTFYWLLYPLLLIFFIAAVFLLGMYYKRKADVQLTRNRKASKLARARLKLADRARKAGKMEPFFEETEKAIWGYLSDKLGIELSELSRDRVAEILGGRGVDEAVYTELFRIIDDCEFSRYAPSEEKSDPDVLYNDAAKLIRNLEQNIRK